MLQYVTKSSSQNHLTDFIYCNPYTQTHAPMAFLYEVCFIMSYKHLYSKH